MHVAKQPHLHGKMCIAHYFIRERDIVKEETALYRKERKKQNYVHVKAVQGYIDTNMYMYDSWGATYVYSLTPGHVAYVYIYSYETLTCEYS